MDTLCESILQLQQLRGIHEVRCCVKGSDVVVQVKILSSHHHGEILLKPEAARQNVGDK
jgi:hypothetical protein